MYYIFGTTVRATCTHTIEKVLLVPKNSIPGPTFDRPVTIRTDRPTDRPTDGQTKKRRNRGTDCTCTYLGGVLLVRAAPLRFARLSQLAPFFDEGGGSEVDKGPLVSQRRLRAVHELGLLPHGGEHRRQQRLQLTLLPLGRSAQLV